jgi:hypothetical protein
MRAGVGGYADDVAIFAGNTADMQIQLDKVGRFSTWSGLFLNTAKCEASAILHGEPCPTHVERWTAYRSMGTA